VAAAPGLDRARFATYVLLVLLNGAILTNLFEPFQLPKLVVLVVGAAVLLALAVSELAGTGAVRLPAGRPLRVAGALLGVLALTTVVNGHRLQGLFGDYGRGVGLLAYVAVVVVFLAVVRSHRPDDVADLGVAVVVSTVPVIGIALLQVLGRQPFGLSSETSDIVGTLGQANFVAGYAGVALPFALWAAIRWRRDPLALVGALVLAAATVVVGYETHSFQALPAMAAGVLVLALVLVHERFGSRILAATAVALLVVAAGVGIAGHTYLDREVRSGLDERVLLWQAGRDIALDHPVLGTGPSGYVAEFSSHRPRVHVNKFGVATVADSPHDVPLGMFVIGGLPLGLLYLAIVGATGVRLVRGLRRTSGETRLLLAAFGGGWLAYQVQSLVSIETASLLVAHAVTAAGIWVLTSGISVRTVEVPGLVPVRSGSGLVRRSTVIRAGAVAIVLGALWATTLPVRADVAYRHSLERTAGGDIQGAVDASRSATALTPWQGRYWAQEAAALTAFRDDEGALAAGWKAAVRTPSFTPYAITAGQVAHQLGHDAQARRAFAFAVEHGPQVIEVATTHAAFLVDTGDDAAAIAELRRADRLRPHDPAVLTDLARALERTGQAGAARTTWGEVLELQPGNADAIAGAAG
jgi:hypothetical protein